MKILIKRAYDDASDSDGYRVLVDRLWPRGVKKELLQVDEWCKEIAPSTQLRKWFDHKEARFEEFKKMYQEELAQSNIAGELFERAKKQPVITLVYGAKDPSINHAVVLKEYLQTLK